MRSIKITSGFLAMALWLILLPASSAHADTGYVPTTWNGKKIYLSPAKHSPDNTGCDNYKENVGALAIATETAKFLQGIQYKVRVGSGAYTQNIASSNAWDAHIHIPIHSNATTSDCSAPYVTSRGGTWFMHASSAGNTLAQKLRWWQVNVLNGESPGTNDKICTDQACFGGNLAELRNTDAVSAYIEVAFHTYRPDVDYMRTKKAAIASWIASGIDEYLGYPRVGCSYPVC